MKQAKKMHNLHEWQIKAYLGISRTYNFWPRAKPKVPKRSFIVVVLVVGVETWAKNVTNVTKNVSKHKRDRSNKKCLQT